MNRIKSNSKPKINSYSLRIFLLIACLAVFATFIGLKLFDLQILNYEYYQNLATRQQGSIKTILPKRGEIYLTPVEGKGEPLLVATNITKNLVFAVPKQIASPGNIAAKLAPLLQMSTTEIESRLSSSNSSYVLLKKQLSDEVSEQINEMKLLGIYLEPETLRYYPEKNLASQVLGFLGYKGDLRLGQYGIEGNYEKSLAGSSGEMGIEKDQAGRWITLTTRSFTPAQDGDNIFLTIDPAIQFKVQEVLKSSVEAHQAESGSAIVLDPKTGAVLAMANYPDFDPNEYSKVKDLGVFLNNIVSSEYEPGSVFKPITLSAAINEQKVTPDTIYTDTGLLEIDDRKIQNSDGKANGVQTMTQVLEKSLNTGAVFAEQQLGNDLFRKYVKNFGFGSLLDFELPGQAKGNIDNLNRKGNIFFATAAFGQGITATPLQIAAAFTAFANGGKMMNPYVVKKIAYSDQTEQVPFSRQISQVIDSKTAASLSAMLVNVVENGHGKQAAVKGYYIAGKTGTAQVAFTDRPGYDPNRNIGTFVGFGPVDNPAFVALVRIHSPKNVKFAESTAAPAFGQIASFILNYLQIPPSRQ